MAAIPQALTDWYSSSQLNPSATVTAPTAQDGLLSATSSNPTVPSTSAPVNSASVGMANPTIAPVTTIDSVAKNNAVKVADPTVWNNTPDQTVAGQLTKNLSSGSPLMQQANTQGLETANSRGLLNSSMAAGAAENAMITNAMPIATADAQASLGINRYNTDTTNNINNTNAAAANNAETANTNTINNATQLNAAATNNNAQYNSTNAFVKQQALFDANVKTSLAQIDNTAKFTQQSAQLYAGLSDGFNRSITSINQDVNMNQQSKDYSISQLYNSYKAQISLLSAVGSIPDVSSLLINTPA